MSVAFQNFLYSFSSKKGKQIFVPNEDGIKIGYRLIRNIEAKVALDKHFFNFRRGGHVAALHLHRNNKYFLRSDLKNFFYSISRNRMAHVLYEYGIGGSGYYAKWSSVRNPYAPSAYSLPYGFVQSPLVSAIVLMASPIGKYLKTLANYATVSVYMDDIAVSSNDMTRLEGIFKEIMEKIIQSGFAVNVSKTIEPTSDITVFNCSLKFGNTNVTTERIELYNMRVKSEASAKAFDRYCKSISVGNEERRGLDLPVM